MISKLLITFLGGILLGFLLHMIVTGDLETSGGTSVEEMAAARIEANPPATAPHPPVRENAGETGLLLRKFLADRNGELDTVKRERDEAFAELLQLSKELLLSYGTMDEAGATVGGLLRRIMEFENLEEADVDDAEQRSLVKDMVSLVAMSDAVRELDANPSEASRYQSAVLKEIALLSETSAERARAVLEQVYRDAGSIGVNYASRPEEAEAIDAWVALRSGFYQSVYTELQGILSPAENDALADFNVANGFMPWKLVDPFDPAVFVEPGEYTGRTADTDSLEAISQ